jgi:hypothetical protein
MPKAMSRADFANLNNAISRISLLSEAFMFTDLYHGLMPSELDWHRAHSPVREESILIQDSTM